MIDQRLTTNFTLAELCRSDLAARYGIDNTPPGEAVAALTALAINALEPIRALLARPLIVTSGYRCPRVNALANGSPRSQHQFGEAADFIIRDLEPGYIWMRIRDAGIEVDQCIVEFGQWVHVSWRPPNRRQFLIATLGKSGPIYTEAQ